MQPPWRTCLITDFTICALSGPWRSRGNTPGTTRLWQEVGSGEVWRKYHKDRETVAGVATPIVTPTSLIRTVSDKELKVISRTHKNRLVKVSTHKHSVPYKHFKQMPLHQEVIKRLYAIIKNHRNCVISRPS